MTTTLTPTAIRARLALAIVSLGESPETATVYGIARACDLIAELGAYRVLADLQGFATSCHPGFWRAAVDGLRAMQGAIEEETP